MKWQWKSCQVYSTATTASEYLTFTREFNTLSLRRNHVILLHELSSRMCSLHLTFLSDIAKVNYKAKEYHKVQETWLDSYRILVWYNYHNAKCTLDINCIFIPIVGFPRYEFCWSTSDQMTVKIKMINGNDLSTHSMNVLIESNDIDVWSTLGVSSAIHSSSCHGIRGNEMIRPEWHYFVCLSSMMFYTTSLMWFEKCL